MKNSQEKGDKKAVSDFCIALPIMDSFESIWLFENTAGNSGRIVVRQENDDCKDALLVRRIGGANCHVLLGPGRDPAEYEKAGLKVFCVRPIPQEIRLQLKGIPCPEQPRPAGMRFLYTLRCPKAGDPHNGMNRFAILRLGSALGEQFLKDFLAYPDENSQPPELVAIYLGAGLSLSEMLALVSRQQVLSEQLRNFGVS